MPRAVAPPLSAGGARRDSGHLAAVPSQAVLCRAAPLLLHGRTLRAGRARRRGGERSAPFAQHAAEGKRRAGQGAGRGGAAGRGRHSAGSGARGGRRCQSPGGAARRGAVRGAEGKTSPSPSGPLPGWS